MIHIILIILESFFIILIYTAVIITGYFIREKFLVYYQNWKAKKWRQKAEKDYEEYLQRKRRRELQRIERERYPLFYLKEGIV